MLGRCLLLVFILLGLSVLGPVRVLSQDWSRDRALSQDQIARSRAVLDSGRAALKAGRPEQAVDPLASLFREMPAYDTPQGSVAYWLGRAYVASGRSARAVDTWRRGLTALEEAGRFDVRLSDAFIRYVFGHERGDLYPRAGTVYRGLLRRSDSTFTAPERMLLNEHLEALAVILPEELQKQTGLRPPGKADRDLRRPPYLSALKARAGARLLAWWRAQDTLPATAKNERLEEHLERAVYARRHYAERGPLDDRGTTYIRLGAPYKQTEVDFGSPFFRNKVLNRNPTVTAFDFRPGEFWVYRHVDRAAHYLFVEDKRAYYKQGRPEDLLPSTVKGGFVSSARGRRKAAAYVRSMTEVYRQLALYHEDYAVLYQEVANYADLLDISEFTGQPLSPSQRPPFAFAQHMSSETRFNDRQVARRRSAAVPRSYADPLNEIEALPVEVRLARFLGRDGTTRTEVYWSLPAEALPPSRRTLERLDRTREELPERYLFFVALRHYGAGYRERAVQREMHLIEAPRGDGLLRPQTYTVRGDTGRYHLAMQWDSYVAYADSQVQTPGTLGPRIKAETYRADSLRALTGDKRRLEMSDLKPLLVPGGKEISADKLADAPPYPFQHVTPSTPLALYFEVYHLAFDAAGQTRYTVEYELFRRTEREGLKRLFQGSEKQRTTTETTYTGASRTEKQHIVLDLGDQEAEGTLRIRVRVTDERTGQQVERSISFEGVPKTR